MGRTLSLLWLAVVAALLVVLGQGVGLYDVPLLRSLLRLVPMAQPPPQPTAPPTQASQTRLVATPSPAASPLPARTEECNAASPRFVHGAASLKAALGAPMGEPVECERVIDPAGNTEQTTTTGLAYYRAQSNTAAFTNGFEHWALTPTGLVHWTGDEVEPPPNAERVR